MAFISQKQQQCQHDRNLLEATHRCQQEPYFDLQGRRVMPPSVSFEALVASSGSRLYRSRRCYICKEHFTQVHHFYHRLCPDCAAENYQRRQVQADLQGRVALVTGGRIKIGFEIALKLLRAGAKVHITTRFKYNAAMRFAKQADFAQWKARLIIHELDLRHLMAVEVFTDYLATQEKSMDIVINNAAQTLKKPASYFQQMAEQERLQYQQANACLLSHFCDRQWQQQLISFSNHQAVTHFAPQDEFGEPVDCAATNSWLMRLGDCSTLELMETQLVNAMAPFVLNSRLKPLLLQSQYKQRFIINVSAMEGQFNRKNKTQRHPHTNMAKAALNMMTRTAAIDYAQDRIFMNSVDTGWVTQENPLPIKVRHRAKGVVPPLDCVDGAARVLAPIWDAVLGKEAVYGVFLKDYQVVAW